MLQFLAAILGSLVLTSVAVAGPPPKVEICHYPPDDPTGFQTINIPQPALASHLAHGDVGGPCPNNCNLVGGSCDDGNACTVDTCNPNGTCSYAEPTDCNDSSPCTTDSCDPTTGDCVNEPVTEPTVCDDGNACTDSDVCGDGLCEGTAIPGCCLDDAECADETGMPAIPNLCTDDTCTPERTCDNVPRDCPPPADPCLIALCAPDDGSCQTAPKVCPTGEQCQVGACIDINECATNNGGCDPLTLCDNDTGSFDCGPCPIGYTGSGDTGCTDLNECAVNNGGCSPVAPCTNTAGSRTCGPCPSGYTGPGLTCTDINECATNNGGCSGTCANSGGGFSCP
jgi:hypothetical protein